MEFAEIVVDNSRLRPHQVETKQAIYHAWKQYNAIMVQMPTGTGKTFLFCSIINDIITLYKSHRKEINILVVAHRTELLEQISETLVKFDIQHGFIQGSREQRLWHRVQVGSIQSLLTTKNYHNTLRQRFDFIIVDEAHHSLADTYVELFNLFPKAKKLGVTATPWRLNHESFLTLYQTLVTSRSISWFIRQGVLSDFDYISIKPESEIQKLVNNVEIASTGDFINAKLDLSFNNLRIRSKLFESYLNFAKGRKGIIYAINRTHASMIAQHYSNNGVRAVAIDCETPKEERENLIRQFKSGLIQVLVNVDIFTEGFDCPDVSFIQLARPTRSLALYLQQVGRGLRFSKSKEKTIILDNVGLYNYFGLPDANRKWQYHFRGQTDVEPILIDTYCSSNAVDTNICDPLRETYNEINFEEDNEQMVMIHGTASQVNNLDVNSDIKNEKLPRRVHGNTIEEFIVADYYLVRGNSSNFKIYTLLKKRGRLTQGISASVFEYDAYNRPVMFSSDSALNSLELDKDIRLKTILLFSANLLHLNTECIYQLDKLSLITGCNTEDLSHVFNILRALSKLRPQIQ